MKFNLYCDSSYLEYTKKSKYIEWFFDDSEYSSLFINEWVTSPKVNEVEGTKFAWFLKPDTHMCQWLEKNIQYCLDTFQLIIVSDRKYLSIDEKFVWCPPCITSIQDKDIYQKSKLVTSGTSDLEDYMFSVVIEDDIANGHFSEKILDCFLTGTIPVYSGAPDIGEYFNESGIISINDKLDLTSQLYYSKRSIVVENFYTAHAYENLINWIYFNYLL